LGVGFFFFFFSKMARFGSSGGGDLMDVDRFKVKHIHAQAHRHTHCTAGARGLEVPAGHVQLGRGQLYAQGTTTAPPFSFLNVALHLFY